MRSMERENPQPFLETLGLLICPQEMATAVYTYSSQTNPGYTFPPFLFKFYCDINLLLGNLSCFFESVLRAGSL